jgi:predicted ATPase
VQQLDLSPDLLRGYSTLRRVERLGERGENFAAVVRGIVHEPATHAAYVTWLQQMLPAELDDVAVLSGALGEPLFAVVENVRQYTAPILSDGTLRFAALAAAFFQPDMPKAILIEEIENGIHPTRLRVLMELLKSQAKATGTQVFVTTHSPMLLAWLDEDDYRSTFVCQRDEETGESRIRSLASIPHFKELAAKQSVGELFAEGWLEAVP